MAHSVAFMVVPSPSMIEGFATDTIVVSIRIMKKPSTMDHRAGHGRISVERIAAFREKNALILRPGSDIDADGRAAPARPGESPRADVGGAN
ncbi:hypothetical protein GCM10009768_06200 [Leucobacter iarius]|uniref:Uncharacterized protein n=1 Tax=Leucobacter iarius TaxID=333963 RepID=A0ABP4XKZ0_9MICO